MQTLTLKRHQQRWLSWAAVVLCTWWLLVIPPPAFATTSLNACAQNPTCAKQILGASGASGGTGSGVAAATGGGGVSLVGAYAAAGTAGTAGYFGVTYGPDALAAIAGAARQSLCAVMTCTGVPSQVHACPGDCSAGIYGAAPVVWTGVAEYAGNVPANSACPVNGGSAICYRGPKDNDNYADTYVAGVGGIGRLLAPYWASVAGDAPTGTELAGASPSDLAAAVAAGAATGAATAVADQDYAEGDRVPGLVIDIATGGIISTGGYTLPGANDSDAPGVVPGTGAGAGTGSDTGSDSGNPAQDDSLTGTAPSDLGNVQANQLADYPHFIPYAISVFTNRFPMDILGTLPSWGSGTCPSFTFFGETHELCIINTLLNILKLPALIGSTIWAIYTL